MNNQPKRKVLVIGVGSIGERHVSRNKKPPFLLNPKSSELHLKAPRARLELATRRLTEGTRATKNRRLTTTFLGILTLHAIIATRCILY